MIRAFFTLIFLLSVSPVQAAPAGAPDQAAKEAAAAIEAPKVPSPVPAPPSPPGPASPVAPATNLAPPLPGQLQATPMPPRPALAPPAGRVPDLPRPALTPAPSVPINPAAGKAVSSTSSSGQFIVHGDDLKLRSAFSGRCEEIAATLRQFLRDKESWELPVVVLLKTGDAARVPGPAVSYTISQISHGGFHLQVNVNIRGDLRPADVQAELIRILLAERILRRQKQLTSTRERLLPDWVFTGVLEALEYRQRARPSALFAAIFKSGKIYGIEEIIEASASTIEDGLSKTIYQTSCCALVLALLEQPEGGLRLGKFLNSLASDKRPERELLNQWFPGFAATPASLNKWWSLQMANLASPSVSEPLSPAETAKHLEQALTLRYKAKANEVPKPRPVVAAAAPSTAAAAAAENSASAPEDEDAQAGQTDKLSFLRRLIPFGRKEKTDLEVIEEAAAEAALAEAKPAPPAPGSGRRPLFSRLGLGKDEEPPEASSGAGDDSADSPTTAGSTTPAPSETSGEEAKTVETPSNKTAKKSGEDTKAPSAPADGDATGTPAEEGKGSVLNPLNWFRGGKKEKPKDEPEAAVEDPAKKSAQTGASAAAAEILWTWSPLAGDLWLVAAEATEAEAPESRKVEGFLGLKFGRKKKPAAEAEVEAPKTVEPSPKTDTNPPAPSPKGAEAPKPTEAAAAPTAAAPEENAAAKTPPAPIKIKPLFGSGKKAEPEAPTIPVEEAAAPKPKAPAKASGTGGDAIIDAALPIEEYQAIMKRKDRVEILKRSVNNLAALQSRAAVLFRPIVSEYGEVLAGLVEGKTKGVDERLRSLRTRTQKALTQSKAVRDFLDLYEANESPVFSGLFDDYLKLSESIDKELPARMDPLSNYLDALDREFSKE